MQRQFAALRGLAIATVVLYHSIDMGRLAPRDLGYPPVTGWLGVVLMVLHQLGLFAVPTFLFISGCFVAYAARGKPPRLSWKVVHVGLTRMLWPYLIWSVVFFAMAYFRRGEEQNLLGYVKNLLVGYPFHFMPLLFFFYAISPILVRLSERFGYTAVVVVAVYQVYLLAAVAPDVLGLALPGWAQWFVPPVLGSTMARWGLFFPLGIVYSLQAKRSTPWLHRLRWVLVGTTVALFVLTVLDATSVIRFPLGGFVVPLALVGLHPLIKRQSIPAVRRLEHVGKRSYGLYLMHLVVLEMGFWAIQAWLPWLLGQQVLLQVLLYAFSLGIPLLLMDLVHRSRLRSVYRYVFG